MSKNFQIEEGFEKIEDIIGQLEENNCNLEESLELYSKGVEILSNCNKELDRVEKQIIVLREKQLGN